MLHGVVEMLFTYLVCLPGSCSMPSEVEAVRRGTAATIRTTGRCFSIFGI